MDAEGWSKVLVVAASSVVVCGSALQALEEMRQYEDIYDESSAKAIVGQSIRFALPRPFVNPFRLLYDVGKLITLYVQAIDWAKRARKEDPQKWARAVIALTKARNWGLVLVGAMIAVLAGSLDLVHYVHEH